MGLFISEAQQLTFTNCEKHMTNNNKATLRPVQVSPYKWVRKDVLKAQEREYWKRVEASSPLWDS